MNSAYAKGSRLYGCHPYLAEDKYREHIASGRIRREDVATVLAEDLGPDAECGRGLLLVQTLSAQWGYYPPDGPGSPGGKIVWARCELP